MTQVCRSENIKENVNLGDFIENNTLTYSNKKRVKDYENRARNGKQNLWTISEWGKDKCLSSGY